MVITSALRSLNNFVILISYQIPIWTSNRLPRPSPQSSSLSHTISDDPSPGRSLYFDRRIRRMFQFCIRLPWEMKDSPQRRAATSGSISSFINGSRYDSRTGTVRQSSMKRSCILGRASPSAADSSVAAEEEVKTLNTIACEPRWKWSGTKKHKIVFGVASLPTVGQSAVYNRFQMGS